MIKIGKRTPFGWESTPRPYEEVRVVPEVIAPKVLAKVFWLLRRYTSLTFNRHIRFLLDSFVAGFEKWAWPQVADEKRALARGALRLLYRRQSQLHAGIHSLAAGDRLDGYIRLFEGLQLAEVFAQEMFGFGRKLKFMGYNGGGKPAEGLYSWYDKAAELAIPAAQVMWGEPTFRLLLPPDDVEPKGASPVFPKELVPLPPPQLGTIRTGEMVPVSGVWVCANNSSVCPTYLVRGNTAPKALVATCTRIYEACITTLSDAVLPEYTEVVEDQLGVYWSLAWADERYSDGKTEDLPEEQEFLDESTLPPTYPPVVEKKKVPARAPETPEKEHQ